jgi:hypothetical protein
MEVSVVFALLCVAGLKAERKGPERVNVPDVGWSFQGGRNSINLPPPKYSPDQNIHPRYFNYGHHQQKITPKEDFSRNKSFWREKCCCLLKMALAHPPIPEHLRPHIWAKSMYNYPAYPNLPVDNIAEFLFTSMNIAQTVPFVWEFIDAPAPGSLFFVWMSPQLFANPPTDGYQYLDPERVLHLPVGDKVETIDVSNQADNRWWKYTSKSMATTLVQKQ